MTNINLGIAFVFFLLAQVAASQTEDDNFGIKPNQNWSVEPDNARSIQPDMDYSIAPGNDRDIRPNTNYGIESSNDRSSQSGDTSKDSDHDEAPHASSREKSQSARAQHTGSSNGRDGNTAGGSTDKWESVWIQIEPKIEKQLGKRGWTKESVKVTIQKPSRTVDTRDTRHLPDGTTLDDPAIAYINPDGSYVIRNSMTMQIVQVSDRYNPNWKSPFD